MDDLAFLAMFKMDELPDCETALSLLKMWVESDPKAVEVLQHLEKLDVGAIQRHNTYFSRFVEHSIECPKCGAILA